MDEVDTSKTVLQLLEEVEFQDPLLDDEEKTTNLLANVEPQDFIASLSNYI